MKPTLAYLAGMIGGGAAVLYGWPGVLIGAGALLIAIVVSIICIFAELADDRARA